MPNTKNSTGHCKCDRNKLASWLFPQRTLHLPGVDYICLDLNVCVRYIANLIEPDKVFGIISCRSSYPAGPDVLTNLRANRMTEEAGELSFKSTLRSPCLLLVKLWECSIAQLCLRAAGGWESMRNNHRGVWVLLLMRISHLQVSVILGDGLNLPTQISLTSTQQPPAEIKHNIMLLLCESFSLSHISCYLPVNLFFLHH